MSQQRTFGGSGSIDLGNGISIDVDMTALMSSPDVCIPQPGVVSQLKLVTGDFPGGDPENPIELGFKIKFVDHREE
ncbi:hypothetical protein [Pseudoxanthomonas suwonensis]|uniref:Uncharacterized protein n=1 Tax=Pseudoxanthomonas suwonensis TaxID=314722 RepID=A0A0E3UNJ9_9GAMM|nr:hypothetical protein [Pseudoxanthomonas suwonensis]AKC87020.1 hypothetical protein WQ53_09970 [Pseudoxanthomonas suwonensis]